jgi:phosphoglycolate phosphatase-like HAD superfamily hydrolase
LTGKADLLVVSATPNEALAAEWREHDLAKYVRAIYGQEYGSKKEVLAVAKRYPANQTLMIGDAPGDHKAAVANDALFFPINPGHEEASWRRLFEEGIDRFFGRTFVGDYQLQLLDEFNRLLPEHPPWNVN